MHLGRLRNILGIQNTWRQ